MKISEVLWRAANDHLWDGSGGGVWYGEEYSCLAAGNADGFYLDHCKSEAVRFLKSLGCKVGGMNAFNKFTPGTERQGARYAWLMFASMYAEELGL